MLNPAVSSSAEQRAVVGTKNNVPGIPKTTLAAFKMSSTLNEMIFLQRSAEEFRHLGRGDWAEVLHTSFGSAAQ